MQDPGHSNAPPELLVKWPALPPRKKHGGNDTGPPYPWRSTTAEREKGSGPGRPLGRNNRNRRDHLLRRFGLTAEQVDGTNQITPLLRQMGMLPSQLIDVLRADDSPESKKIVAGWDSLTPASRNILGLEALALAVGLTTRILWELYNGANLVHGLGYKPEAYIGPLARRTQSRALGTVGGGKKTRTETKLSSLDPHHA